MGTQLNILQRIVRRQRGIHRVNMGKISVIPDISLSNPSEANFANDEGQCIETAIEQYSADVPRLLTVLVNGSPLQFVYKLNDAVPDWDTDNYAVDRIQFPLVSDVDNILDASLWTETLDPITQAPIVRFARNDPGNGNLYNAPQGQFVIWYVAPHTWDYCTNSTSVPKRHVEAVAQLAACEMLKMAATVASQFSDKQTIENKDMGALPSRLIDRAKECMEEYERLIGKDEQAFSPTWVQLGSVAANGWMPFHPQTYLNS